MKYSKLRSWVEKSLVERLHAVRMERPHLPTLQSQAAWVLSLGLDLLEEQPNHLDIKEKASPGETRRALAIRVPKAIEGRTRNLMKQLPDTPTLSSAVRLALWVGINQLKHNMNQNVA